MTSSYALAYRETPEGRFTALWRTPADYPHWHEVTQADGLPATYRSPEEAEAAAGAALCRHLNQQEPQA